MTEAPEKMPDMSAVRCAVEHACSHQEISLFEFAKYAAAYLVRIVLIQFGEDSAQSVINAIQHELDDTRSADGRPHHGASKH